ncbi:MAG: tyrosinase [Alphaproteobacteria bacterium]|nr:tyrosinase [Alphaproteobacteria bacterium]
MNVDIQIPGIDAQGRVFLTWAPVPATARLLNGPASGAVPVTLRNKAPANGPRLEFATTRTHNGTPTLTLSLPADGTPVAFFIAGEFQRPSTAVGDAVVEAVQQGTTAVLGTKATMVRIRKNAQTLSPAERDRFIAAMGTLNGQGAGRFRDFRDMHVNAATAEEHGNVGFLPWHRAYLLDLERELQAIDPSVALPYWRFDQPAPSLFTRQFIGTSNSAGRVQFAAGHPFENWRTDGVTGIVRSPDFAANEAPSGLLTEEETLNLAAPPNHVYGNFVPMEFNPHGNAHTSFGGSISKIGTAAKDPLFFLLHANVDRLWAKWQWVNRRTDSGDPGAFAPAAPNRVGHRLNDTMWPWNGITTSPRPSTAPGGTLAPSTVTSAPGPNPTVRSMIDSQAVAGGAALGFAYDDVPFEN